MRAPGGRFVYPAVLLLAVGTFSPSILGLRSPHAAQEQPATADAAPAAPYDWLQMNGDPQHSGNNTRETVLGPSNVTQLTFLFQVALPSAADGAPVLLSGVPTVNGTQDLLFITTKAGLLLALDASNGAQVWSRPHAGTGQTNSSPAIDPNRLFVYSYGLDGFVHKHQVGDGTEITAGGWPELVTLKGGVEKVAPALAIATAGNGATYLYVAIGGYIGDGGDYQGHVTAINLTTGAQKVFNSLCSDQTVHFVQSPGTPDCGSRRSAIWAKDGVIYDDVTDRIYMATGNGPFDGNVGGHNWGDSIFSLAPDGSGANGKPLDSYTPTNYASLESGDVDLGSTGPAILPAPGYSGRLAAQSGKDSALRLIELTNMSGQGGPGHLAGELQLLSLPQGGVVLTVPAVWVNPGDGSTWVFVTNGSGSAAYKLTFPSGSPALALQWNNTIGRSSPLVANNVLYITGNATIRALSPTTGAVLWSDSTKVGSLHWQSPVVVNSTLFMMDESAHLTAYGLPSGGTPTQTATNTPTNTRTSTNSPTNTRTSTNSPTSTRTSTPTSSPTSNPPTNTPSLTPTITPSPPPTSTRTPTPPPSITRTNTSVVTPTFTPTPGAVIVPPLTDFRDVRRASDINPDLDLGGTGQPAINFTGSAGSGGDAWITVYDATPGTPDEDPVYGNVNLSADVLIQTYNNKKGAGLLSLFNEGAGQKGLSLIVYDSGNSDSLALAVVNPATGQFTALTSVSLGGNILEKIWYRVTMSVVVSGANVAVTGKVFRHTVATDPNSPIGAQVGVTLNFSGARPSGVDAAGEVGIVAGAASTAVNSSVTNFTISP
jgi:hypothetical protein